MSAVVARWALGAAALVVLLLAIASYGYVRGDRAGAARVQASAQKKVDTAHAAQQRAEAERDAARSEIDGVQRKLELMRDVAENAKVYADAALADRNRLQHAYDVLMHEKQTQTREIAHAQADCRRLVVEPVCPAVAERLRDHAGQAASAAPRH